MMTINPITSQQMATHTKTPQVGVARASKSDEKTATTMAIRAQTIDGIKPIYEIALIDGVTLAAHLGFEGKTSAFRVFIRGIGIQPVPGRKDRYDPKLVHICLDKAQGIVSAPWMTSSPDNTNQYQPVAFSP